MHITANAFSTKYIKAEDLLKFSWDIDNQKINIPDRDYQQYMREKMLSIANNVN